VTFYSHPSTDNKGGRATKNTMGRWSHIYLNIYSLKMHSSHIISILRKNTNYIK
jgi:hypothetical protein